MDEITRRLPVPPTLPGISWRSAESDDAPGIAALEDACFEVDGGYREVESEIRDRWESDYCSAPEDSMLAFDAAGNVVAVAWSYVPSIAVSQWKAFDDNFVHPDHRSAEMIDFVWDWWEERSRQRLEENDDGLDRVLWHTPYDFQEETIKLLERRGFEPMRYYDELLRDLAEPIDPKPLPQDLTIRPWKEAPLADSLAVHNAAFSDHWGSQPMSENRWKQNENEFFLPEVSFVVYEGDVPISYLMSAAFPHDFEDKGRTEAWVEGLGTVRSHRKRGIGSALVTRAIEGFKLMGMEYAVLGVDSDSPTGAHALYTALGFVPDRRSIAYLKSV